MGSLRNQHNVYFSADATGIGSVLEKAVTPNIRFHSAPLSFIQKRIGRLNAFFLRNETDALQRLDAEFEAEGEPELWDSWTGKTATIVGSRRTGNWVQVELDLQPLSSALIVFDPDGSATSKVGATTEHSVKRSEVVGASGWKLDCHRPRSVWKNQHHPSRFARIDRLVARQRTARVVGPRRVYDRFCRT